MPDREYLVLFVEKVARSTPWEQVTHIFCRDPEGEIRKMLYFDARRDIREGVARFYVMYGGRKVELEIGHDALGNKRLLASIDGEMQDVLSSLPDYRDNDS